MLNIHTYKHILKYSHLVETKLISGNSEPRQCQLLIAPSLVDDTQFRSGIFAGLDLKIFDFCNFFSPLLDCFCWRFVRHTCMSQVNKEKQGLRSTVIEWNVFMNPERNTKRKYQQCCQIYVLSSAYPVSQYCKVVGVKDYCYFSYRNWSWG